MEEEAAGRFVARSRSAQEEEEEVADLIGKVGRRPRGRIGVVLGSSSGQGHSCGCLGPWSRKTRSS